jgi:tetratricopeptide (TPR) repeat protein
MSINKHLFNRAEAFARAGRLDEAFKVYNVVLLSEPGNFQALYRIAVVELMRGRIAAGTKLLRKCLRAQSNDPDILFSLGRDNHAQGEDAAPIRHLTKAAKLAPDRADIISALGNTTRATTP